ncbi:hypothetical protein NDU88_000850 [Pleurodeles waltl]|uniref:Uncharacterized protein n=1 Tax=Pleurodeles waltl TaxID=8319 RepID=A0AAV7V6J8_PLEWA|nr:hypothetical protein NDU88_000850 [Pleurodeles waltl]
MSQHASARAFDDAHIINKTVEAYTWKRRCGILATGILATEVVVISLSESTCPELILVKEDAVILRAAILRLQRTGRREEHERKERQRSQWEARRAVKGTGGHGEQVAAT